MPTIEQVAAFLAHRGVPVQTFASPTPTSATAAAAVGCTVGEIAKSVLFIVGPHPVVVVTSGDRKVVSSSLKKTTGLTGKVRLPDAAEVLRHTGYAPGGVCPFLLPPGVRVLVDVSLRRFPTVYPAAGDPYSAVPITVDRLLELTGARQVDVCAPLASVPSG